MEGNKYHPYRKREKHLTVCEELSTAIREVVNNTGSSLHSLREDIKREENNVLFFLPGYETVISIGSNPR